MKLEEFLDNLVTLTEENPKLLQMDVVYSRDDEGNGYDLVHYPPSIGNYDGEEKDYDSTRIPVNAVCIN
jgi:hypothetical protein